MTEAAQQTPERTFTDRLQDETLIRDRMKRHGIPGELVEITTAHRGPGGKPYWMKRLVVMCVTCGKAKFLPSVNRANAVYFWDPAMKGVPREKCCECGPVA